MTSQGPASKCTMEHGAQPDKRRSEEELLGPSTCAHTLYKFLPELIRIRTNCQTKMADPSRMLVTLPGCSHEPLPSGIHLTLIEHRKLGWSRVRAALGVGI